MEENDDFRSDSAVKNIFKEWLKSAYQDCIFKENVKDADICVKLANREKYYFEIKKVTFSKNKVIFGSATLTEWKAAKDNSGHYFFVIAIELSKNKKYDFHIITPDDFMKYSYIPPFKVYFNIPYTKEDNIKITFGVPGRNKDSYVIRDEKDINTLQTAWESIDKLKLGEDRKKVECTDDFIQINTLDDLKKIIAKYSE